MCISVDAKLEKAHAAIEEDDLNRACNLLNAFMNEVDAQAGNKLTDEQAVELLECAEAVRESIGCLQLLHRGFDDAERLDRHRDWPHILTRTPQPGSFAKLRVRSASS